MADTRICAHCGYTNATGAVFCGNCGRSLAAAASGTATPAPQSVYCPNCEQENPAGATFCGNCGQSLVADGVISDPEPVITPQPPPPVAQTASRKRPQGLLLVLTLVAGTILVAAVAAFFLLPRFNDNRMAELRGVKPDAVPARPTDGLPPEQSSPTADDQEDVAAAVAALSDTPKPTVTPFPTGTPRPTLTPMPTRTSVPPTARPSPTPVILPTSLPTPTSPPPVACQQSPGDRWGPTLWNQYRDRLGCATTGEIHPSSAYQYYQHAMMVWREVPDLVYVLYNNGTFDRFPAAGPEGYFDSDWLKGSFGHLWNNNAAVRDRVGQPEAAEFNTTDFAAQDFAGGTIFYFLENDARNYVLFNDNGTWVSAQK